MDHRPAKHALTYLRAMLGGLMLVAVIALVVLVSVSRRASVHSAAVAAAAGAETGYRPRETFDTVGFASVVERIPRWAPDTSLEEMSQIWQRAAIGTSRTSIARWPTPDVARSPEGRHCSCRKPLSSILKASQIAATRS